LVNGGRISGIKGASTLFSISAYQSTSLSHIWVFTSYGPFSPRRFDGFLYNDLFMKSAASMLQPAGKSLLRKQIYFEKI